MNKLYFIVSIIINLSALCLWLFISYRIPLDVVGYFLRIVAGMTIGWTVGQALSSNVVEARR